VFVTSTGFHPIFLEREFHEHRHFVRTLAIVIPVEILIAVLYCVFYGIQNIKEWEYATKPLPMLLLIGTAMSHILYYGVNRLKALILTAFVLSLIADVVLIPDGELFFLGGLAVFLLAHVFYIIAFTIAPIGGGEVASLNLKRALPFLLLFMIIPPLLVTELVAKGHPFEIIVGVVVYSFILSSMGWRSAARVGYPSETLSSQMVAFVGVMFFICSDFLLAINRFHTKIPLAQVWVLPTYWIAQTLIAISLQRRSWGKSSNDLSLQLSKSM